MATLVSGLQFSSLNLCDNKNAFQWDAYRPLIDRMPQSASRGLGGGPGSDPPQFPPWVCSWIWSPSISLLGVGLDLIPLNFPLGCGPGPDPPQFPPWVWAWGGVLSWPFVVVFCYALLLWCGGLLVWSPSDWRWSSVMAFWYSHLEPPPGRPYQKATLNRKTTFNQKATLNQKTTFNLKSEDHFQPEGHQTRRPPNQKPPWSRPPQTRHTPPPPARRPAARHAGIHTPPRDLLQGMLGYLLQCTPPPNRITHTCNNITLATTSLRPVIKMSNVYIIT